jgi:hypothetical protein
MPRGNWDRAKAENWVRKRAAAKGSLFAKGAPPDLVRFLHRRMGMSWPDFLESLGIPILVSSVGGTGPRPSCSMKSGAGTPKDTRWGTRQFKPSTKP